MKEVFILSAQRTPVGSFLGQLSSFSAPALGSIAIKSALEKANVPTDKIDECIMGQVLTSGSGQAPARQAALGAGLPQSVACLTINKVCGSGLKSIMLAADSLALGNTQIAVAGGQESMSQAPYLMEGSARLGGYRMGHQTLTDSMIKDGLWDPYSNWHMGQAAELCVKEFNVTRTQQDEFAIESYKRAQKAQQDGLFLNEITPIEIKDKKGNLTKILADEEPSKVLWDKIPQLKPAFDKEGSVTAANASKINDGAAACVLATQSITQTLGLKPLARLVSHATHAQDPKWFTTAPAQAIKKALQKAQLTPDQIDLWEINEAFAIVSLVAIKEFSIPLTKVNVNGGAIAIGHPLGASGARILTTLVHALKQNNKRYGLATLCIGGGEAVAVIIENL